MKRFLRVLVVVVALCSHANAADFYVNCDLGTGANTGTSWDNAWRTLSAVNWATVRASLPSTLWLSGDADNTTCVGWLKPTGGGTDNDHRLFIKVGQTEGHDGVVVIDHNWDSSSPSTSAGIWIAYSYVTVDGKGADNTAKLHVTHGYGDGVYVTGAVQGVDVGYLDVYNNGSSGTTNTGVKVVVNEQAGSVRVHDCKIHDNRAWQANFSFTGARSKVWDVVEFDHNEVYNFRADAVAVSITGFTSHDNRFHNRLSIAFDYSDVVQTGVSGYLKWYNNTHYDMARANDVAEPPTWTPDTEYRFGDLVLLPAPNAEKRFVTEYNAGVCVSGPAAPAWDNANGHDTNDGTCRWRTKYSPQSPNVDNTYWPCDWGVNAHIKISPVEVPGTPLANFMIYNNLLYETETTRTIAGQGGNVRGIEISTTSNVARWDNIYVLNNTVTGMDGHAFSFTGGTLPSDNVTNFYVLNNIFKNNARASSMQAQTGGAQTIGSFGDSASIIWDYNIMDEAPDADDVWVYNSTGYAYSEWQTTTGANTNGFHSDPTLDNTTYAPLLGSPAIDNGVALPGWVDIDIEGGERPAGATWDIGAYEGAQGEEPEPPSDNTAPAAGTTTATPTGYTTTAVSWSGFTDAVGVVGYLVYRDGILVSTQAESPYNATGLSIATTYSWTVKAYDAAGNVSDASEAAVATTLAYPVSRATTLRGRWQ